MFVYQKILSLYFIKSFCIKLYVYSVFVIFVSALLKPFVLILSKNSVFVKNLHYFLAIFQTPQNRRADKPRCPFATCLSDYMSPKRH